MKNPAWASIPSLIRPCAGVAVGMGAAAVAGAAPHAVPGTGLIVAVVEVRSSRRKEAGWLLTGLLFMLSGVAHVGAPDNYHAIYRLLYRK